MRCPKLDAVLQVRSGYCRVEWEEEKAQWR